MNTINRIEKIRRANNGLWMMLLKIALESAPFRTKQVLRKIRANDLEISDLFGRLSK